ncbi:GFA family protein [Synechococcus sp. Nb3U1]|uniref:GFA family protein n=1 Tax=Synechococcus sp. Nb3U1 TaxID=1914529 RepID=UPI001F3697AA|nr:GFA family protein [Synechococcus sp. Nb3U1]MCF2970607.1 GFA family protein [Synechococcus sp. Nb3U1]
MERTSRRDPNSYPKKIAMAKQRYEGSCHCGQIRFVVEGDLDTATLCNCSICTKKGFIHLIVPPEAFQLLSGQPDLATYSFNTHIAKHHFCRVCGMHPFYIPRSDPDKIDVNVRCLDGIPLENYQFPTFNGRDWEQAIEGKVSWRD